MYVGLFYRHCNDDVLFSILFSYVLYYESTVSSFRILITLSRNRLLSKPILLL